MEVAGIRYEKVESLEAGNALLAHYNAEGRPAMMHVETLEVRSWA